MSELRTQFAGMLSDVKLITAQARTSKTESKSASTKNIAATGTVDNGRQQQQPSYSRSSATDWFDDPLLPANRYANRSEMVKAVLTAALAPQVAVMADDCLPTSRPGWLDAKNQELFIHPASVNHGLVMHQYRHHYVIYLEKAKTSKVSRYSS